ncbi:aminotransferase class I/II-fold pyridoxal phosphate-dependent enzyme [Phosphitispora sp. TUW77]|uniref:aminotransferase class I/II-fold pyridoxal phosphate-dependent enzyme n=1 Tax=Phosphitispora sp. TUW77 TaxID=3152361 RepID=UPI003AB592FF
MHKSGYMPLIEALQKNKKRNTVPFHMPGHKKGQGIHHSFARLMKTAPFALDVTELPGLDDLHNPAGPIKESQMRAARVFGADRTFFLINGSTVGIHAALLSVCRRGEEVLLPRDMHRSVIGACILGGLKPRYLPVQLDPEYLVPYPPATEEITAMLQRYPKIRAIFQVYPSYYGLAGKMLEVAEVAHRCNIPLIVDEAHGAHFVFTDELPQTALQSGADISIQSTHKTLGAFTQASMLHVKSKIVDYSTIARQLGILQSTSPSYLLMASLDAVTGHMEVSGKHLMDNSLRIARYIREQIKEIPGIKCFGESVSGLSSMIAVDPTKIYISLSNLGLSGYQAAEILLKKHRIQVELCDRFCILCMLSIGSSFDDADRLVNALTDIASKAIPVYGKPIMPGPVNIPSPRVILNPEEAWFAPLRQVLLKEAVGEVAGELIAPYPPGIPLLCPGEMITNEIVDLICELKAWDCMFHGFSDPAMLTIKVVDRF